MKSHPHYQSNSHVHCQSHLGTKEILRFHGLSCFKQLHSSRLSSHNPRRSFFCSNTSCGPWINISYQGELEMTKILERPSLKGHSYFSLKLSFLNFVDLFSWLSSGLWAWLRSVLHFILLLKFQPVVPF
ncbi:hypothetical protein mRhiFer1_008135 [Rhinolophus ferrumequinum]|uniref:Uncharacterized protein n=1 Tax=Rhinolophus ferrumequinum TaxID=59479 RepID=A0A7J7W7D4_RHIFE|nr:hypothetical protein mRhiFer1_008135 [Rhinolophus ferrumequinum]